MPKSQARSTLYRLIEAGQLTHKALLVPLVARGLEPGDDAMLFVLHDSRGTTREALAEAMGMDAAALEPRIVRLIERDLVAPRAIGPELAPGLALTERGERIRKLLAENWDELETALLGELPEKDRKRLRKTLGRFADLLRLG